MCETSVKRNVLNWKTFVKIDLKGQYRLAIKAEAIQAGDTVKRQKLL